MDSELAYRDVVAVPAFRAGLSESQYLANLALEMVVQNVTWGPSGYSEDVIWAILAG